MAAIRNRKTDKSFTFCEVCRKEQGTTVCGICLGCGKGAIEDRKRRYPRSEGKDFLRYAFGLGVKGLRL